MSRRFQFSLSRLLVATLLIAVPFGVHAADEVGFPANHSLGLALCVAAYASFGMAIGCLFRRSIEGAALGLIACAAAWYWTKIYL
ncbi:MAG TPA: hypothetical protein VG826_35045 [Pirellulales bacterium]|nr:hypothetical protein [Pirellulales bacterium]